MYLLFNMLSWLVVTFLPKSKHLLISWLQSPSAVILEPPKIVWHCFHCLPIYFPWGDGTRCHLAFNWWLSFIVLSLSPSGCFFIRDYSLSLSCCNWNLSSVTTIILSGLVFDDKFYFLNFKCLLDTLTHYGSLVIHNATPSIYQFKLSFPRL